LCSRILHYTSTELVFECKSTVYCECRSSQPMYPSNPSLLTKISQQGSTSKRKIFSKWHHLINLYSQRNLSNPSDKLPAISGIAEKFSSATGSSCLAGLWRDNLIPDLLWSSMPYLQNPHHAHRLSEYRAPSWSWASVDTQFHYEDLSEERDLRSLVGVENVVCKASGMNALGEVKDGELVLVGLVARGILVAPTEYSFSYHLKLSGSASVEASPDSLLVEDKGVGSNESSTVRRARKGEVYKPFRVLVTCLAVATTTDDCIYGLILGRSSRIKDAYERLGLITCGHSAFGEGGKETVRII